MTDYDLIFIPKPCEFFQVQFPHWERESDIFKYLELKAISFKPQQQKMKMEFSPSTQFQNIEEDEKTISFESSKRNIKGHHLYCIPDHSSKRIYAFSLGPAFEMQRKIEGDLQVKSDNNYDLEEELSEIMKRKDFSRFLESKLRSHSFQKKILQSEPYTKASHSFQALKVKEKVEQVQEMNFMSKGEYIQNLLIE